VRFDLHLQSLAREQFEAVTGKMKSWEVNERITANEADRIREAVNCFSHTTERQDLRIAGVDASGDFPLLNYADSFIYLAVAQATVYGADRLNGLKEVAPKPDTIFHLSWMPENAEVGEQQLELSFEQLAGLSLLEVIERSDYRQLKQLVAPRKQSVAQLLESLIRPLASDTGNLAIQLRSTAEFGTALRLLNGERDINYLLVDTTFSLPLLPSMNSLFYEHLKRLCCVEARTAGIGFFALSKSHGLTAVEQLEALVKDVQGLTGAEPAEHWCLRIPEQKREGWELSLAEGRRLPPIGAVSYLVRFHRTTPMLRLDIDSVYWEQFVRGASEAETRSRERKIFEDLDYGCHDMRVYGYPYPIHAAHMKASLTNSERAAFRKQVIAEAVKQGMRPILFRDPSKATGHR